ncbi:uncharacterized protein LOC130052573 isoform X2 [Ostrea edulis]|uniref:uncharacterized protein LOC130052573 isoform X2 n=1 Tax=Ostrea edulis TaxID=37623 RepID=UPI0024AF8236|nr:uncharacterized protein LOC130052573 isoform X2 [Ostrea edulis]
MWVYRVLILAVLLHTCFSRLINILPPLRDLNDVNANSDHKQRLCQKTIYVNCGNKDSKDSNENGGFLEVPADSTTPQRDIVNTNSDDRGGKDTTENSENSAGGTTTAMHNWG